MATDYRAPLEGPGMLWVSAKPKVDEAAFTKWADEVHIPAAIASGGLRSSVRTSVGNTDEKEMRSLILYSTDDMSFFSTPGFQKIPFDTAVADFDVRSYSLVEVYDPQNNGTSPAKMLMVCQLAPGPQLTEAENDRWYIDEHNYQMTLAEGYLRSTRFRLCNNYHTGHGESSLPSGGSWSKFEAPRWLAIHEFGQEVVDFAAMLKRNDTEWQRDILPHFAVQKVTINTGVVRSGEGEWFESRKGYLNVAEEAKIGSKGEKKVKIG